MKRLADRLLAAWRARAARRRVDLDLARLARKEPK